MPCYFIGGQGCRQRKIRNGLVKLNSELPFKQSTGRLNGCNGEKAKVSLFLLKDVDQRLLAGGGLVRRG